MKQKWTRQYFNLETYKKGVPMDTICENYYTYPLEYATSVTNSYAVSKWRVKYFDFALYNYAALTYNLDFIPYTIEYFYPSTWNG